MLAALALAIQLAAVLRRPRLWWAAVGMFLVLILIFFTLASWGNSDTTRFSHALQWKPDLSPPELLWVVLRPLILVLPYRMAGLHGLIATGFALAAVLLARGWRAPAWAGWWALFICCSPLLRGFLQNAHSRQALASLLLLTDSQLAATTTGWAAAAAATPGGCAAKGARFCLFVCLFVLLLHSTR